MIVGCGFGDDGFWFGVTCGGDCGRLNGTTPGGNGLVAGGVIGFDGVGIVGVDGVIVGCGFGDDGFWFGVIGAGDFGKTNGISPGCIGAGDGCTEGGELGFDGGVIGVGDGALGFFLGVVSEGVVAGNLRRVGTTTPLSGLITGSVFG